MKVGSINLCLHFCQFYYTYETCKNCALQQRKKYMYKYIDLTVEAYEEYFAISFSSEGVLLNSIMEIHCSTAKGVTDQNRMAVRDWWSKFFTLQRSCMNEPKMEELQKPLYGFEVFDLRIVYIKAVLG